MKKIILFALLFCCIDSIFAVTFTSFATGAWGTAGTWNGGAGPAPADALTDVIVISSGTTVTDGAALSNYSSIVVQSGGTLIINGNFSVNTSVTVQAGGTLTVNGALDFYNAPGLLSIAGNVNVTGNVTYDQWQGDQIDVLNGGNLNISGNLGFPNWNAAMSFTVEAGGSSYIGGTVTDGGTGAIAINIYGYMEVVGNITSASLSFNNHSTGVLLIHGAISGNGASSTFTNDGLITVDGNFDLSNIVLQNDSTGKVLVFGDIEITGPSKYINAGFVQATNMNITNLNTFTNTGTTVVLDLFNINPWSGCPCNLGTFYYGSIYIANTTATTCGGYCDAYWAGQGKVITTGRRIWLSASIIGYGLSSDSTHIKQWFDLANSYGFDMSQSNSSYQPLLKDNTAEDVNFNPVMKFEGSQYMSLSSAKDSMNAWNTRGGLAMFAVVKPTLGGATVPFFDYGLSTTKGLGMSASTANISAYTATTPGGAVNSTTGSSNVTLITQTTVWPPVANNQVLSINGSAKTTTSVTLTKLNTGTEVAFSQFPTINTSGPVTVGASSSNPTGGASFSYSGNLAELIVYACSVSATVQSETETYLALKYGITLPHDFLSSGGTTVWDHTINNNDVAGIARDDLNFLQQRQSKSINSSNGLTVSTGSIVTGNQKIVSQKITSNASYLIWGHNGRTSMSDGTRIYKFTSTNFYQYVTMQFANTGLTYAPTLVIASDSLFTASSILSYSSGTYSAPNITYTNVNFPNNTTSYCKFLIPTATSTPGVLISETAPLPTIKNSAELEVYSKSRGVLIPSMTTAQMTTIASPANGLLIFNSDIDRFMFYKGAWTIVGGLLSYSSTDLNTLKGIYLGQLVLNTSTSRVCYWNGTNWIEVN